MKRWYVVVGLGAGVLLASCMAPSPTGVQTQTVPSVRSGQPASTSGGPGKRTVPTGSAQAALAELPIKGRAPRTGYVRDRFGERWTDDNDEVWGRNGCDTRNDVLRRDLADVVLRSDGCKVSSGTLRDPYTGAVMAFVRGPGTSSLIQIDHVVPLADAWQTGAQQWTARERQDFANDPLELISVAGAVNEAKSDGDAATWLPPNRGFRCAYAARMIAIKLKWHLWVTAPEHDALARLLAPCGAISLPGEPGALRG